MTYCRKVNCTQRLVVGTYLPTDILFIMQEEVGGEDSLCKSLTHPAEESVTDEDDLLTVFHSIVSHPVPSLPHFRPLEEYFFPCRANGHLRLSLCLWINLSPPRSMDNRHVID